jgi:hypothetical protein
MCYTRETPGLIPHAALEYRPRVLYMHGAAVDQKDIFFGRTALVLRSRVNRNGPMYENHTSGVAKSNRSIPALYDDMARSMHDDTSGILYHWTRARAAHSILIPLRG